MDNNRKQWRKVNSQNEEFSFLRYSRKRRQNKSYLNNRKTRLSPTAMVIFRKMAMLMIHTIDDARL